MCNGELETGYVGAPTLTNVLVCVTASWEVAMWVFPQTLFHTSILSAWVANLTTSWCQILTENTYHCSVFGIRSNISSASLISLHVAIQTEFFWNSIIHISKLCKVKSETCCTFCISYYILSVFVTNQDVSCRIKNGQNMPCDSPLERSVTVQHHFQIHHSSTMFHWKKHCCANLDHV